MQCAQLSRERLPCRPDVGVISVLASATRHSKALSRGAVCCLVPGGVIWTTHQGAAQNDPKSGGGGGAVMDLGPGVPTLSM
jgi:hypothetical protein